MVQAHPDLLGSAVKGAMSGNPAVFCTALFRHQASQAEVILLYMLLRAVQCYAASDDVMLWCAVLCHSSLSDGVVGSSKNVIVTSVGHLNRYLEYQGLFRTCTKYET